MGKFTPESELVAELPYFINEAYTAFGHSLNGFGGISAYSGEQWLTPQTLLALSIQS